MDFLLTVVQTSYTNDIRNINGTGFFTLQAVGFSYAERVGETNYSQVGQEKAQVQVPGVSKFRSWASKNRSSVARWASEISLSSLPSLNENVSLIRLMIISSQKLFQNIRLQD